jgi:hypothetical protein
MDDLLPHDGQDRLDPLDFLFGDGEVIADNAARSASRPTSTEPFWFSSPENHALPRV